MQWFLYIHCTILWYFLFLMKIEYTLKKDLKTCVTSLWSSLRENINMGDFLCNFCSFILPKFPSLVLNY